MSKYHTAIAYLTEKNTRNILHGQRSLFDHLVGVYDLLKKYDQREDLCLAGLFHSIYGTTSFTSQTETDRTVIKNIIGEEAEKIVWNFSKRPMDKNWNHRNNEIKILSLCNQVEQQQLLNVWDNNFNEKEIDLLYAHYRDKKSWKFIGHGGDDNKRKFNYKLDKKDPIDKILFKKSHEILVKHNLHLISKLVRAYASGYIYGTISSIHRDVQEGYNNYFTIMFYLNKFWESSYAGETIFLTDNQDEIFKSVIPKPGRAIIFDGFIPHGAREVSRECIEFRMVVTFNYIIKSEDAVYV
jgi:hypothetical protein